MLPLLLLLRRRRKLLLRRDARSGPRLRLQLALRAQLLHLPMLG